MSQENNFIPDMQPYKRISPFRLFVKSNFPFIENTYESLDNYGLYCKVVEYLNTVIANENTVENNVQALYNAFVELNTYVSNYFDNLDVQEEINNKLDDMVEQGTLQEIISAYLNSKAIFGFDNVGDMIIAENLIDGSYAKTMGYHNINDGGRGLYKIREKTNDDVIDNMKIIQMNNTELVAELIDIVISPEMVGAYGDGVHDDTTSLNCALSFDIINLNAKTYKISDVITAKSNSIIIGNNATINKTITDAYLDISNTTNLIIKDLNIIQTEDVYGYLLLALHCENLYINNIYLENKESTPADDAPGMWAMFLSGENIIINNIKIDNYQSGYHADGIHIADVQNLIIDGFDISSGDDAIALNTPTTGQDIVSNNILITNGIASSYRANIFRIDSGDNNIYSNACYKNVEISNIICNMKDNNIGMLCRFTDQRPELISTAKHDNILIKNIIMKGYAKNWVFPMIGGVQNDYNHYGKIVFDNVQGLSYQHQVRTIDIAADNLIFKNCYFSACEDGTPFTEQNSEFKFTASNEIIFENCKFESILYAEHSLINPTAPKVTINNCIFKDRGNANGFGIRIDDVDDLILNSNNANDINQFIRNTVSGGTISKYYFMNNIYKAAGLNVDNLEKSTVVKIVEGTNLKLFSGLLNADANNRLLIPDNVNIHIASTGLVITLRRAATGEIFNAYFDAATNKFVPVNYTVTEGQSYYAQFWI